MSHAADPAPVPADPAADAGEGRLSILAAILLGLAATLTALSSYQAALSDGEALAGYSESNAGLTSGVFGLTTDLNTVAQDQIIFREYATANYEDNVGLSDYIYNQMSPDLQGAVDWWLEDPDAVTPFDEAEGNPYTGLDFDTTLLDAADARAAEGAAADEKGDKFELASVLLALTLFFAGIATLFRRRGVAVALLTIGLLTLTAGSVQLGLAFAA